MSDVTAPQTVAAVPVELRTRAEEFRPGMYLLASVTAPDLSAGPAVLVLGMNSGRLRLIAPCGCEVGHHFGALVLDLAKTVARGHAANGGSAGGLH